MFTIGVDPVAFTIGSLEIRWYGIMLAIAIASAFVIIPREARRLGITYDIYAIFFSALGGALIGGRLAHVIQHWPYYVANPQKIIGFTGLAQMGMIIGIIVAALIYMAATKMRFSTLLSVGDAFIVAVPLALAIGRIGCTLNGCCTGIPAPDLPWAVIYTHPNSAAPLNTPLHPTQIYHALWNLIVFATVWRFRGKLKPEGSLLFFGLCIGTIGDLGLRFLRGTHTPLFLGLDSSQLIDLGIFAIFLTWFIIRLRRFQKQALVTEVVSEPQAEQSRED
jgi:phosphatidylglycerol:prolipoprotein diacylglycerol transferase